MELMIAERVPGYVLAVTDALARHGYRGYLVGGSLRDLLRGVTPHDFDLTTNATPDEMLEVFADFRVIPTGIKHGTLTVMSEGHPIEVTTHRVDGEYSDARHPEEVSFTRRLADDLSRRDFTVNAMAWHPDEGLVDLFEGGADLENGIIRAVGDPALRFGEDALRILRAFRFSAQLNFEIEEKTLAAARKMKAGLERISVERIYAEMTRLLASKNAARGMKALFAAACEREVFFDTVITSFELNALDTLPEDAALRLAFLLRESTPDAAYLLCRRWHAPNAFCDRVAGLLRAFGEPLPTNHYTARRFVCAYFHEWEGALLMLRALHEDVDLALALCRSVVRDKSALEIRRLAVNGRELQEKVGVLPAKTGELLSLLQDLCWQDPQNNKKATLLALAKEICEKRKDFL